MKTEIRSVISARIYLYNSANSIGSNCISKYVYSLQVNKLTKVTYLNSKSLFLAVKPAQVLELYFICL